MTFLYALRTIFASLFNMKHVLIIIGLTFFQTATIAQETGSSNNGKGGLLWKVEAEWLKKPSYLFGTCHMLNQNVFNYVPGFWQAYNNCDYVMIECGIDSLINYDTRDSFIKKNIIEYQGRGPYSKMLKQTYGKIEGLMKVMDDSFHKEITLPSDSFQMQLDSLLNKLKKFRESLDSQSGDNKTELSPEDFNANLNFGSSFVLTPDSLLIFSGTAMDIALTQLYGFGEKTLRYCENFTRQMQLMDSMFVLLNVNIDDADFVKKELTKVDYKSMDTLCYLYLKQDLNLIRIEDYLNSNGLNTKTDTDKIIHLLLYERNVKWIERFNVYFREGGHFVGIGIGHLPGENGLIQMLRKAGYTVTPFYGE